MNKLQIFNHPSFGQVEIIDIDGKPWFGASKTASALGYVNPRDAIAKHCRTEGVAKRDTLTDGGTQEMNFIDEGNLYRLIVKSRLPLADKYERWVFDEVLPTIRKTGSYNIQQESPSYMLDDPIARASKWIEEMKHTQMLEQQNAYKDDQLKLQEPKVALYDVAMAADGVQPVGTVAKELGLGRTRLFAILRDKKVLRQNNEPYQEYIERGYFKLRMYTITHKTSGLENKTQPMVTAKGMAWIQKMLKEA